jgi:Zn-dependent protease
MDFSHQEKKDLFFSGILISLAFAILLSGGYMFIFNLDSKFVFAFFAAFFTAGLGFLLHEIAHKIVAVRYNLRAEFKAYYPGIFLALMFSLLGFIIAAPGAVHISGFVTKEKNGKISAAGPLTNIILGIIFFLLLLMIPYGNLGIIFRYGLTINGLLAVFNMLPIIPFDGSKVLSWSKFAYTLIAVVSLGILLISFTI